MARRRTIIIIVACIAALIVAIAILYTIFLAAPGGGSGAGSNGSAQAQAQQFTIPQDGTTTAAIASGLKAQGLIKNNWAFTLVLGLRAGGKTITPGGYELMPTMNAWQAAGVLASGKPALAWVVIPPGLRKEEIAAILAQDLGWTSAQTTEWITVDTGTAVSPDYFEGVYFPDTYLIPVSSTPAQVAARLVAQFNTSFAPYAAQALQENIKWTTALTLASIIQREAAGPQDMALISGILWNRLLANPPMKLQVDSTVQYARGNADAATGGDGWWAPITPADESIVSPYNTYLNYGLPPHPISDPGLDAIAAALNPASTSCLYYIHDASGTIHCSATYAGQEANIQEYLQ